MRNRKCQTAPLVGALVCLCGTVGSVHAQDSVGFDSGVFDAIVGDGNRADDARVQCTAYTVDLGFLATGWGVEWGIGPVVKGSKLEAEQFSSLFSNNGISLTTALNQDRSADTFEDWDGVDFSQMPAIAPGVNPDNNNGPTLSLAGPSAAAQVGFGVSEFGGEQGVSEQSNVIGGRIAWDPADAGRLYVDRVVAAMGAQNINTTFSSDMAFGSADEQGNVYFIAEDFNAAGPLSVVGESVLRVRTADRDCDTLNWINSQTLAGVNRADNDLLANDLIFVGGLGFEILPPNNLPDSFGRRAISTDAFLNDSYRYEDPANVFNADPEDHVQPAFTDGLRGQPVVATQTPLGGIATVAQLVKPENGVVLPGSAGVRTITNPNGETWGMSLAAVGPNGDIIDGTERTLYLPWAINNGTGPIIDPAPGVSGQDPNTGNPYQLPVLSEFDQYRGLQINRGPGQMAIGSSLSGELLVAAVCFTPPQIGLKNAEGNALVVGKVKTLPEDDAPEVDWVVAAWNNFDGSLTGISGKAILDGPGGSVIARMVPWEIVTNNNLRGFNATSTGPSMSTAGFDSAGNLYFTSAVQILRGAAFDDFSPPPVTSVPPLNPDGSPNDEYDLYEIGLIRAVYDPQTCSYDLDLVLHTGQVFSGGDTGLDYLITRINQTTNNNAGLAPSAFSPNNVNGDPRSGGAPAATNEDPSTLGGLLIQATIIYDVDGLDTVDQFDLDAGGDPLDYPIEVGGSGPFESPATGLAGGGGVALFPDSTDQAYNVLLFVGNEPFAPGFDGVCCFACDPAPVPGNCPDASGAVGAACTDANEADCIASGGVFRAGLTCADAIDPCQCPGDLNGDGEVDVFDFGDLASNFGTGTPSCATRAEGDVNCDGVIDVFDFGDFASNFGCSSN